ncbi:U4/U6.U5 small nuclear ribonucleoprotein 27 kDa protein-like isoform X2 [Liolophura sinensis]|uniref:U4/U6.U5 small nuclear ribonucleoprotein 27 kDa protein-like isoform X2 n=1 Tax=Liolophura sinensis TaxID=3198878 RepID=UPI003158CD87
MDRQKVIVPRLRIHVTLGKTNLLAALCRNGLPCCKNLEDTWNVVCAGELRERRRSRSRERRHRHRRSRSRSRSPKRYRSRSPHRRSISPRRRSRSRSRDRKEKGRDRGSRDDEPTTSTSEPEVSIDESQLAGKTEDEIAMMKLMGFCNFDTTKNKQVNKSDTYVANIQRKRRYRQYMNRKGGFNRPLDFIA